MVEIILPDDILIGVGYHLPEGRRCFRYDPERLNTFFYEQKLKWPQLLNCLSFDRNGLWSVSTGLSQAISNLIASSLIVISTSEPKAYTFSNAVDSAYKENVESRIPTWQIRALERLAMEFNNQLAINARVGIVT